MSTLLPDEIAVIISGQCTPLSSCSPCLPLCSHILSWLQAALQSLSQAGAHTLCPASSQHCPGTTAENSQEQMKHQVKLNSQQIICPFHFPSSHCHKLIWDFLTSLSSNWFLVKFYEIISCLQTLLPTPCFLN